MCSQTQKMTIQSLQAHTLSVKMSLFEIWTPNLALGKMIGSFEVSGQFKGWILGVYCRGLGSHDFYEGPVELEQV
jgi:hypothetical protein